MAASAISLQMAPLPALECGEIHVWHADLDVVGGSSVYGVLAMLAADERAKAESFRFERERSRYVAARGILRSLLGRYLDVEPEGLRFSYGPFGKPFLAAGSSASTVHFNISHANGRALFAFSRDQEIGVDLERIQATCDFERLAASWFPLEEIARLHSCAATERLPEFFRIWTRLEAYGKACGMGLSILDSNATASSSWSVGHFYPEPGYVAAIAAKNSASNLRHYAYYTR